MSRERIFNELCGEDQRVQYDSGDGKKLDTLTELLKMNAVILVKSVEEYKEAISREIDENAVDAMKEARFDLILKWAAMQSAVSKLAWTIRLDADEAFDRVVKAYQKGEEPDMSGL